MIDVLQGQVRDLMGMARVVDHALNAKGAGDRLKPLAAAKAIVETHAAFLKLRRLLDRLEPKGKDAGVDGELLDYLEREGAKKR